MLSFVARFGLALVCGMALLFPAAGAEEKPKDKALYVPLGGSTGFRMPGLELISEATYTNEAVLKVEAKPLDYKEYYFDAKDALGDPTGQRLVIGASFDPGVIHLYGLSPGKSELRIVGSKGTKETHEVIVRRELALALDIPYYLRHPSQKALKKAQTSTNKVVWIQDFKSGTSSAELLPKSEGQATITLTDVDGKVETIEAFVRKPNITLTVGDKRKLQLSTKQRLSYVQPEYTRVVKVDAVKDDGTSVEVEAREPGCARVILANGERSETIEVAVSLKAK